MIASMSKRSGNMIEFKSIVSVVFSEFSANLSDRKLSLYIKRKQITTKN